MSFDRSFKVNNYALAYFDVLNQTEHLRKMNKLPENEEEYIEFVNLLRKTFGVIDGFRKLFDSYFIGQLEMKGYFKKETDNLNAEQKEAFRIFQNIKIDSQLFSDTVLYYTSLGEDDEHIPMVDIMRLFHASASTMVGALAGNLAVRGAIEVGIGSNFFKDEIYGPVLYHAHYLESEVAKYPRIVIGKELFKYIKTGKSVPDKTIVDNRIQYSAERCFKMIYKDVDGVYALDYLGEVMYESISTNHEIKKKFKGFVKDAYKYIVDQYNKHMKEKNQKLTGRYYLLKNYFDERRKEYWS